ncbi:integrase core domain-containing protein [Weissella confusa]|uniref:integrase core domain-containing protein n=1 Tax=Weissella confusa TaxID=1583 RepID=UPI003A5B9AC4
MVNHDVHRSMSRPGTPYDNAVMERWWNYFKLSWMDKHPTPTTLKELRKLVSAGIDYFNYMYRPLFLTLQHKFNFYYFMCQLDGTHCTSLNMGPPI